MMTAAIRDAADELLGEAGREVAVTGAGFCILLDVNTALNNAEGASLSPYLRLHINRFGHFPLDMEMLPPDLVYDPWIGA